MKRLLALLLFLTACDVPSDRLVITNPSCLVSCETVDADSQVQGANGAVTISPSVDTKGIAQ